MIDIVGLYDTLLTASLAGVPFRVLGSSDEVGRRIVRFLYPGVDEPTFQDLGAIEGTITVRGLLVGDDYVAQARALRSALKGPGPYTLVHPWLGQMQVVLARPASIRFAQNQLRIAHFDVAVYRYADASTGGILGLAQTAWDTLSDLEVKVDALTATAQNWIAVALTPAVLPLAAFSYAQGWLSNLQATWSTVLNTGPSAGVIYPASAVAIADLSQPTVAPSASWASDYAAAVAAVPAAVVACTQPVLPSAVAPGGSTVPAATADAADAVAALLAAIPAMTASASDPAPGPALAAAAQAIAVANAVSAATGIDYASQQDAQAQAAILYTAIDAAIMSAATAAVIAPSEAGPVWSGLLDLRSAFAADMTSVIGRLPAVVQITVPAVLPAWLLAQYIAGDTPDQVVAAYQDIVTRNRIAHPGMVRPGQIEVLE